MGGGPIAILVHEVKTTKLQEWDAVLLTDSGVIRGVTCSSIETLRFDDTILTGRLEVRAFLKLLAKGPHSVSDVVTMRFLMPRRGLFWAKAAFWPPLQETANTVR